MNKSAVYKIIIWSMLACFLSILLLISIGDSYLLNTGLDEGGTKVIREQEFSNKEIEDIYIDITIGDVYILPNDKDSIVVTEKASYDLEEYELLQFQETDNKLTIKEQKFRFNLFRFNLFSVKTNKIIRVIKLPNKKFNMIKNEITSGKLNIEKVNVNTLHVNMTSGSTSVKDVEADTFLVNLTSGKIKANGIFNIINSNSTSGSVNIKSDIAPKEIDLDITSGSADISIPENDGFVLLHKKTSGIFRNDFAVDDFGKYKNGERKYVIKQTSGIVKLKKK